MYYLCPIYLLTYDNYKFRLIFLFAKHKCGKMLIVFGNADDLITDKWLLGLLQCLYLCRGVGQLQTLCNQKYQNFALTKMKMIVFRIS